MRQVLQLKPRGERDVSPPPSSLPVQSIKAHWKQDCNNSSCSSSLYYFLSPFPLYVSLGSFLSPLLYKFLYSLLSPPLIALLYTLLSPLVSFLLSSLVSLFAPRQPLPFSSISSLPSSSHSPLVIVHATTSSGLHYLPRATQSSRILHRQGISI